MRIAIFTHPPFMSSQSMPRFARMLEEAYTARGHTVSLHSAVPVMHRWMGHSKLAKWAGYIDQYLLFPRAFRKVLRTLPPDTLFVFCDQALGPWCPLVANRPHVVHAHDLLALRSALGDIPENPTSATGKVYQRYIRQGFQQARRFIAISKRTQDDLIHFAGIPRDRISVVYNDLNHRFAPMPDEEAHAVLTRANLPADKDSMLLHVGGGQWYKNRLGIVSLYAAYARRCAQAGNPPLPLVMVGPPPSGAPLQAALASLSAGAQVIFRQGLDQPTLVAAYTQAAAFLFPSLAEGFGWPIVEAQACGTLTLTTDEAPMSEVGGPSAFYVPRLPYGAPVGPWAEAAAETLIGMLALSGAERGHRIQQAQAWASQFNTGAAIEGYLAVYEDVLRQAGRAPA